MKYQDPVDEVLGMSPLDDVDVTKAERYFKDLERAIATAVKDTKYSEDTVAIEAIGDIDCELGWAASYVHDLIQFYDDATSLLDEYRSVMKSRLTEDELHDLNTINVRNKLETTK